MNDTPNLPPLSRAELKELELIKYAFSEAFHRKDLINPDVSFDYEPWSDIIVIRALAWMYSEKVGKDVHHCDSWPDGWWQMFKYQYFPRRLRDRFPVRWTKPNAYLMDIECIYPGFKPYEGHNPHKYVVANTRDLGYLGTPESSKRHD